MNLMATGGYKNTYVANPKRGYQKSSVIITQIPEHKNGHSIKPNRVAPKYLDFKKDVDLDVHIRMFNFVVKTNAETSKKYIITTFNYMLKDTTSNWCHNYMSKFLNCIFSELTHALYKCHQKI